MATKKEYKKLSYYLALPWTYTVDILKKYAIPSKTKVLLKKINVIPS